MKPLDWITAALAVVVSVENALPQVKGQTKLKAAVDLLNLGAAATGAAIPAMSRVTALIHDVVDVLNNHGVFSHSDSTTVESMQTPAPKTS